MRARFQALRASDGRGMRVAYAVGTSVISKLLAIGVQFFAIPVAIRALGVERYGIFLTLTASFAWISMSNLGVGPGLTRGIAVASAQSDSAAQGRYFSTAIITMLGLGLAVLLIIALAVPFFTVESFFGNGFAQYQSEVIAGAACLVALMVLQVVLSPIEAARSGYLEQYISNGWGVATNIISLGALFLVGYVWPTIPALIVAMFGAIAITRFANGVMLIRARPQLKLSFRKFDRQLLSGLLSIGVAFFLAQLSSLLDQQLSIYLVGRLAGPEAVAHFGIAFRFIFIASSMVLMFTQPLWPAYTDACRKGDIAWIRRTYRRSLWLAAYGVLGGSALGFWGRDLLRLWTGTDLEFPPLMLQMMGAYLALSIWSHIYFMILVGLGDVWQPAVMMLVQSCLAVAGILLLTPTMGESGAGLSLLCCNAVVTAWSLPLLTHRRLSALSAKVAAANSGAST